MPKQVHSAVRSAVHGRWPAEYKQKQKSLYFMVGMFTPDMGLLLSYLLVLSVFLLSLLYKYSQALSLVCWETKRENQSEWH